MLPFPFFYFFSLDPFAVKRNVARTVNSQKMFDYILHCLKSTFKYFALPLNTSAARLKSEAKQGPIRGADAKAFSEEITGLSDFGRLTLQSNTSHPNASENGPEDSDCIIEEEEEVEECSDSDEEREKEKVDLGKSSLSEDEEDEEEEEEQDVVTHDRRHLDSFTTEDEEIFQVDEISGDELLSDEEGPDLDTAGSVNEEEEEEVELAPVRLSPPPSEDAVKDESPENENQKENKFRYKFTKQAFTRGKVSLTQLVFIFINHKQASCLPFSFNVSQSHMVVCSLCKRDGHLKKDCPEDFKKVELDPLPPVTPEFLSILNKVCEQCYSK